MALNYIAMTAGFQWKQRVTTAGREDSKHDDAPSKSVKPSTTGGTPANRLYSPATGTLASGASVVINLQSLLDVLGVSIVATRHFGVRVEWSGNGLKYEPETAVNNGFFGPFTGTTPALSFSGADGLFMYAMTTHDTVDATHKNVKLTNTNSLGNAAALTYKIEITLGM